MPTVIDQGRQDPLVGYHFGLEIQDQITGYFTECSGIGSEHQVIEHKVVSKGGQEVVIKVPGRLKWGDITLKRGITADMELWNWRKMIEDGKVDEARRNGSIVMFDNTLTEVARWNFNQAWPTKISGPSPKADSNDIGVEELTITHEYITRVK